MGTIDPGGLMDAGKPERKFPKLRHRRHDDTGYLESWWPGVRSSDLAPVRLPVGAEQAICTAVQRLRRHVAH
jgi:hypothetical protein